MRFCVAGAVLREGRRTRWTAGRPRSAAALCVAGAVLGESVAALCVAGAVLREDQRTCWTAGRPRSAPALCVAGAVLRGTQQTRCMPGRPRSAVALCVLCQGVHYAAKIGASWLVLTSLFHSWVNFSCENKLTQPLTLSQLPYPRTHKQGVHDAAKIGASWLVPATYTTT